MNNRLRKYASAAVVLFAATYAQAADTPATKIQVEDSTFKCITDMTHVRHFYVDNLLGNLDATVAIAQAGRGEYPPGSVLQLIPNEVMIKHEKGFSPVTRDWEFFYIDIDKDGSKIYKRGFVDVNNRLGLNCFVCHQKAKASFDFVCEQDHGCDPIPITRPMFKALQRTDPRCASEDEKSLAELTEVVKALPIPAAAKQ